MANLQTNEKKKFFIPLELTPETVITEPYKDCEVRWSKIGCRMVRTILIPATEEQYRAYMRPKINVSRDMVQMKNQLTGRGMITNWKYPTTLI